jgi:hypothetical protein
MADDLIRALEQSDVAGASAELTAELRKGRDVWDIHLALFPVVQRVLNPPFINPHLPKMHGICREFLPYLEKEDLPALVRLEVTEYAQRPKLDQLPKGPGLRSSVSFREIENAIRDHDWNDTAALLAACHAQRGALELIRRLLLLGSGYLDQSLGHSVSCTAFILLEMLAREDQDPWPVLATLADYFCKGRFHRTPALQKATALSDQDLARQFLRATSGAGIVNLHHSITRYAMERVRRFFSEAEYRHLTSAWIAFMGAKEAKQVAWARSGAGEVADYSAFYRVFVGLEAESVLASVAGMLSSPPGRRQLGRFLIKGVCDLYQGQYNPHYLPGLGSTLWALERYREQTPIAMNALYQYLDFFFSGVRPKD